MAVGLKESKHLFVSQPFPSTCPLCIPPPPPSSPAPRPTFPMSPVRTPVQMALQQPALPVGAAGMGGFLALCPCHHPQSQQEPKSELASGANAEVRGPSQSGRRDAPGDDRESAKYHTYVTAHTLQQNQTSALPLVNGVRGREWSCKTNEFIVP